MRIDSLKMRFCCEVLLLGFVGCAPFLMNKSIHRAYVMLGSLCALIDEYIACYLPFGCRRYDIVRSFRTLIEPHTVLASCQTEIVVVVFINISPWLMMYIYGI